MASVAVEEKEDGEQLCEDDTSKDEHCKPPPALALVRGFNGAEGAKALGTCAVFMVVGPVLMLVNKDIMDKKSIGFSYPFFVSSLGLIFTSVLSHSLHLVGLLHLPNAHIVTRKFWLRNILPIGACHAATLAFGNAQYLYMGVTLIQFLKAFTPMVVTLFLYVLLGKRVACKVWLALILACCGTAVTAVGDMSIGAFGLVLAAGSSGTEAIRLVLTQYALQDCKFTLMEGQYFLAPIGAACLVSMAVVFELPEMIDQNHFTKALEYPLHFMVAGGLGLGVQVLTTSVIQLTNSTTVKILSQLRNALVVLSGVVLYDEVVGGMQLLGYAVSVLGILWYSLLNSA